MIAIAFLFVVLQPLMDSINSTKSDIEAHTMSLTQKNNFLNSLSVKIEQLASQGDVERQLAAVIPETERSQDIIRVIDQYAKESGVTVITVTNNSSESTAHTNANKARGDIDLVPEGLQTITLQLAVSGTYQQVRTFIDGLQKSPRIVDVVHVVITKSSTQVDGVAASFEIKAYARSEEKPSL